MDTKKCTLDVNKNLKKHAMVEEITSVCHTSVAN